MIWYSACLFCFGVSLLFVGVFVLCWFIAWLCLLFLFGGFCRLCFGVCVCFVWVLLCVVCCLFVRFCVWWCFGISFGYLLILGFVVFVCFVRFSFLSCVCVLLFCCLRVLSVCLLFYGCGLLFCSLGCLRFTVGLRVLLFVFLFTFACGSVCFRYIGFRIFVRLFLIWIGVV